MAHNGNQVSKSTPTDGVLVIGGGVAGVQASLDLAKAGAHVYLVERTPSVGGRMAQLDKTLPTNDCSICILSPLLVEALRHENIHLLTYSEVISLSGQSGSFRATILRKSRYIKESECVGCGVCARKCPVTVPNEFDMGLGERKAIYVPFQQATPLVYTIDPTSCLNFKNGKFQKVCTKCEEACPRGAVDFTLKDERIEVDVGAVIVATGFDEIDASRIRNLGYGECEDVLTGLEFERLLNAAGPTGGKVLRRSDSRKPSSIAFVQCVGSRDEKYRPYCSRVCCVYSIKQCMIAKEHEPELKDIYYFYRDMRAYGRGFEEYYQRGRKEFGIKFIRSSPSTICRKSNGKLGIRYEDPESSRPAEIDVDLVVLSCAMVPHKGTEDLAKILGIETGEDGFFKLRDPIADPVASTREGIFLCGCASGPKDIPDSVTQASAASARALALIRRRSETDQLKRLPENDPQEEPRIGVFVCHCGLNIAGVVDSKGVADYARSLPGVVYATDNLYTCSDDTQRKIADIIRKKKLNRVVVAACTPRTHEPIFRDTCTSAGLNPYLFEMANIRDQCSWVHSNQPEEATEKAKDLVRMAVARARLLKPLQRKVVPADASALVIGGGIAGIQCAIDLARAGLRTYLVEREPHLGGNLRNLSSLFPEDIAATSLLDRKIHELESLGVQVMVSSEVETVDGYVGNFEVKVNGNKLRAGAIILATGGSVLEPLGRYGYGNNSKVITSMQFEGILKDGKFDGSDLRIVFYQCAGARQREGYTGCSRYCCHVSLKQALEATKRGAHATIVYRDMRSFAREGERLYREARLNGVRFLRRKEDNVEISENSIAFLDEDLNKKILLEFDLLVLAVPMIPDQSTKSLGEKLRVPLGTDGFFLERHVKLGPLETNTEGIFLCGCAQYPKDIPDSLAQASGVAAKVAALLSKGYVALEPATSYVVTELCRACGKCVSICEYNACSITEEEGKTFAVINEALCKGCGTCASHCPTGAIVAKHYTDQQIGVMIETLLGGHNEGL